MCECYLIGGPWIAEDPACPVHGYQAQRDAEERERDRQAQEDHLNEMNIQIKAIEQSVQELKCFKEAVGESEARMKPKWIKVADFPPNPGMIVKRFKDGSVWAGYYCGTDNGLAFVEYIQLPD